MYRNNLVFAIIVVLAIAGAWQAGLFNDERSLRPILELGDIDNKLPAIPSAENNNSVQPRLSFTQSESSWTDKISKQINSLLETKQWTLAVAKINDVYSEASSEQLNHFKSIVFRKANELGDDSKQSAAALLLVYAETFDDADAWRQLGSVSADLGDWDTAVTALLASSAQEYEPQAYAASLRALLRAASYARAALEQSGDQLSILALYQRLYDLHPNYTRFQLELAQSHLRLNDYISAKSYLEPLIYDAEFGSIAQQLLTNIESSMVEPEKTQSPVEPVRQSNSRASDIKIPLIRSGNSLLVDVSINSSSMRLLLDTGASITALSSDTIRRLGLKPTGQSITLSTANGLTQSKLYNTDRLQLGRLRLENLLVAEIDLGRRSQVKGLLGTDVLKRMSKQFGYLIDDQQNALIFRKK